MAENKNKQKEKGVEQPKVTLQVGKFTFKNLNTVGELRSTISPRKKIKNND